MYDAWNRLVAVWKDDGDGTLETTGTPPDDTLLAKYQYDGLGRRIAKLVASGENWDRTDYYYNEAWQCLEERSATVAGETTPADNVKVQWLWDMVYVAEPATLSLLALGGLVALRRRR